jgi:hypothetical protein
VKPYLRAAICGLVLASSACKGAPVIDECILTITKDNKVVADCIKPDNSFYELKDGQLDGYSALSPDDKSNLLKWAKAHCGSSGD